MTVRLRGRFAARFNHRFRHRKLQNIHLHVVRRWTDLMTTTRGAFVLHRSYDVRVAVTHLSER